MENLEKDLENLERIHFEMESLEGQVDTLKGLEAILRERIGKQMYDQNIRSKVSPNNKVIVSYSPRRDVMVTDEGTVRTFLQTNGLLDECLRLDLTKVKNFAKKQPIPGMGEKETMVLTVRNVAEKVEAIEPQESPADFAKRIRESRAE